MLMVTVKIKIYVLIQLKFSVILNVIKPICQGGNTEFSIYVHCMQKHQYCMYSGSFFGVERLTVLNKVQVLEGY